MRIDRPYGKQEVPTIPPDCGLQQIIGAALTDDEVLSALLTAPLSLADRFGLSAAERRFLATVRIRDLCHFAALVDAWASGQGDIRRPLPIFRGKDQLAG